MAKRQKQMNPSPRLKRICRSVAEEMSRSHSCPISPKKQRKKKKIMSPLMRKPIPVGRKEVYCSPALKHLCDEVTSAIATEQKADEVFGHQFLRHENTHHSDWKAHLTDLLKLLSDDHSFCHGIAAEKFDMKLAGRKLTEFNRVIHPFNSYHHSSCAVWMKKNPSGQCQSCAMFWLKARRQANRKWASSCPIPIAPSLSNRTKPTDSVDDAVAILRKRIVNDGLITLSDNQKAQMMEIAQILSANHFNDLETTIANAEGKTNSRSFGDALRLQWEEDQRRNSAGSKSNKWSTASIRLALAVYTRSQAAYDALKSFPILNLPASKTLQRIVSANFAGSQGVNQEYLAMQGRLYDEQREKKRKSNAKCGEKYGCLIVDEMKIVSKIAWNSKSNEIYGLAAGLEELSSLHDVYEDLTNQSKSQSAEYCLQTLWRDCTSNWDIAGPYWFSAKTIDSGRLAACVFEAIRAFEAFGFSIGALICDGASYNLKLAKALCSNCTGPFGVDKYAESGDRFRVPSSFRNPFYPLRKVHIIVCPTHMLKNMINLLFASQPSSGRRLMLSKNCFPFGWEIIREMWEREKHRRNSSLSQRVTGLSEADIERDQFTKLSVQPAKKMQQRAVIAELQEHADSGPYNKGSVTDTIQFLEACNQLFENGFLSHQKITTVDKAAMTRIQSGYSFFTKWYSRLECLADFRPTSTSEKRYMSWQTFDLLRLAVYGFTGFCKDFLLLHPSHYIIPFKVNGSAVESYFAQIRQRAGIGAVSSINYEFAAARVMASNTADVVKRKQPASDTYRNEELSLKRRK